MYRKNPGHLLNAYIFRHWDFIHLTRQYINNIIYSFFQNRLLSEKVANAASELISGAFRNSAEESDINISLFEQQKFLNFKIKNYPVLEPSQTFNNIKNDISRVYSFTDAKEAFKTAILEYIEDDSNTTFLVLARIRLETNAKIIVDLENNEIIAITASFPQE